MPLEVLWRGSALERSHRGLRFFRSCGSDSRKRPRDADVLHMLTGTRQSLQGAFRKPTFKRHARYKLSNVIAQVRQSFLIAEKRRQSGERRNQRRGLEEVPRLCAARDVQRYCIFEQVCVDGKVAVLRQRKVQATRRVHQKSLRVVPVGLSHQNSQDQRQVNCLTVVDRQPTARVLVHQVEQLPVNLSSYGLLLRELLQEHQQSCQSTKLFEDELGIEHTLRAVCERCSSVVQLR